MKKLSLLSLLVVATMLLAACGGTGNNNQTPGASDDNGLGAATETLGGTDDGSGLTDLTGTPVAGETGVASGTSTVEAGTTTGTAESGTPAAGSTNEATTSTPNAGAGIPVTGPAAMRSNLYRGSFLLDNNVVSQDGEKLGDVKDILINTQNNQADYVVIGAGGILGIGEKDIAIPWRFLKLPDVNNVSGSTDSSGTSSNSTATGTPSAGTAMPGLGSELLNGTADFVLTVDQSVLSGAPQINVDEIDFGSATWDNEFSTYWNNQAAGSSNTVGTGTQTATPAAGNSAVATTSTPAAGGTSMGTGSETNATSTNVVLLSKLIGADVIDGRGSNGSSGNSGNNSNGNGTGAGSSNASGTSTPSTAGQTTSTPATGMGGSSGNNGSAFAAGETIAKIEDVVINPQSGKVMFVVLSGEQALGLADNQIVPVPLSSLDIQNKEAGSSDVVVVANSQNLTKAPNFDKNSFDFGDNTWNSKVESFWNNLTNK